MNVVLKEPNSKLPTYGSLSAAGMDLYSAVECSIAPGERAVVSTGIIVELPANTYGRIAPRSGLAARSGIDVGAGVVDADYRGIVGVILFNHDKNEPFHVHVGDRIAQMIVTPFVRPELVAADEVSISDRGTNGFGSTGK